MTTVHTYDDLRRHIGHHIECVCYAAGNDPPVNVALECADCGVVLIDYDAPSPPAPPDSAPTHLPLRKFILVGDIRHAGRVSTRARTLEQALDQLARHDFTVEDEQGRDLAFDWNEDPDSVEVLSP